MSTNYTDNPYKYSDYGFAEDVFREFNLNIDSIKIYSDAQKNSFKISFLVLIIILTISL